MLIVSDQYGRLGNNMYQILGVIYMSEKLNDQINIDCFKNTEIGKLIDLKNLQEFINDGKEKKQKIIKHHFFKLYQIDNTFNPKREYFNIGKKIIPFLNNKLSSCKENCLTIHIRGLERHGYYNQLPLSFYVKIISQSNYENYLIITEKNNNNPIIRILKQMFPKIIIRERDFTNFYSLLESENLITPRSTFSVTSLFLNPYLKNVYFIEDLINKDNYYDLLSIRKRELPEKVNYHNYKLTDKYIKVGEWKNNRKNISLMLRYPIEKIVKID